MLPFFVPGLINYHASCKTLVDTANNLSLNDKISFKSIFIIKNKMESTQLWTKNTFQTQHG